MLVDDLAGNVADVGIADAGVVLALGLGETVRGEAERAAILIEEVLLLEAEPRIGVIEDGGTCIGGMRSTIGKQHFIHDKDTVRVGGVGIDGDRLEDAIGAVTLSLPGGGAIEAPIGQIVNLREGNEFLDEGLTAQIGDGLIAVQPDIF